MNPVAWDAVIILTPQITRLIGITEEITEQLLEVRVDMEPIFRIVINEDNSKQKEQFMRISDMLYYQKQRRSIGNWVFLVWWGIVVISSILMPGELGAILFLMVAVWFLALSARLRRKVLLNTGLIIGRIFRKLRKTELVRSQIDFFENDFTYYPSKESLVWKYPAVDKLAEDPQAYYIFFAKDQGMYFAKHCFTVGDSLNFKEFIMQKTGKDMSLMK